MMAHPHIVRPRQLLALGVVFAGACAAPRFAELCPIPNDSTDAQRDLAQCQCRHILHEVPYDPRVRRQLDLLLVIDNSGQMAAKQAALATALGELLPKLNRLDYHIGVVTTDIGSWPEPGLPWAVPSGACDSFAGDDGLLQNLSCLDRRNVSEEAARACSALCPDRRFLPADGARFISNWSGVKNVPAVVEIDPGTGQAIDHGPEYAVKCMALVGDGGCALASPLEAMKRALDNHRPENSGFLRPNSILSVMILTDKDDCSVQLERRTQNDPISRDCPTPDADAPYDCFNPAFRCLARSLSCDQPLNTVGAKTGCRERDDSYLAPVDQYVHFLQTLRLPQKLGVVGIWPLPGISQGAQLVVDQALAGAGTAGLAAAGGTSAACSLPGEPSFSGEAQVRLSHLAAGLSAGFRSVPEASVCSPGGYADALQTVLDWPVACRFSATCFPGEPRTLPDGSPACLVGDVPEDLPDAVPDRLLPACAASCCAALASAGATCSDTWPESTAVACKNEPADCYCLAAASPEFCGGGSVVGVWRKGNVRPPPTMITSFRCATQDSDCGPPP
jgi:hypothetical protein